MPIVSDQRYRTRHCIVIALASALLFGCASSHSNPVASVADTVVPVTADPADVVISPSSSVFSAEKIKALEDKMGAYVADGRLYGIHTRLAHKGEVISDYYTGLRSLQPQAPIEPDTIYRIYSMTKPVTGVAMMMLWEEGKFQLDDPVTKYVPEFEGLKVLSGVDEDGAAILVDRERPPTMIELMAHTSGFAYGLGGNDPANAAFRDLDVMRAPDLQSFIDRTATIPLLFQPGEAWFYSAGMDIQGYIIEKLSGQTFGAFLQTRLFEPLGMTDTGFYVPDAAYDRFSEVFGFDPETGALVPIPAPGVMFEEETIAFESGGGGLVSTMDDYAKFAQMLVNQGALNGVRILQPDTVKLIRTDVLPDGALISDGGLNIGQTYPGMGMGLTFGTIEDPDLAETQTPAGTFFWGGAASTWFWIDPVNELYFIGMVQIFDQNNPGAPLELRQTSVAAVYDALSGE
ncbi:MAG: serine hydrolase domain-containing protein [Pseudomonadota bacterium]